MNSMYNNNVSISTPFLQVKLTYDLHKGPFTMILLLFLELVEGENLMCKNLISCRPNNEPQ